MHAGIGVIPLTGKVKRAGNKEEVKIQFQAPKPDGAEGFESPQSSGEPKAASSSRRMASSSTSPA